MPDHSLDECFPDGEVVMDEDGQLPSCTIAQDGTVSVDYPESTADRALLDEGPTSQSEHDERRSRISGSL